MGWKSVGTVEWKNVVIYGEKNPTAYNFKLIFVIMVDTYITYLPNEENYRQIHSKGDCKIFSFYERLKIKSICNVQELLRKPNITKYLPTYLQNKTQNFDVNSRQKRK